MGPLQLADELGLIHPSLSVYNHYNRVRANLAITERGLRMEPELEDAPDSTSEASSLPMSNYIHESYWGSSTSW